MPQSPLEWVKSCLLDVQPGLAQVIAATTGADTERYVHGPRGVHAQEDASGSWGWMLQDGLGSVRGVADNAGAVLWSGSYEPFGTGMDSVGLPQTPFAFTGEQYDSAVDLLYLRARHYRPGIGTFASLDPFEGMIARPMSLNGYSWVEGNVPNRVDPQGYSSSCIDVTYALSQGTLSNYTYAVFSPPVSCDKVDRLCANLVLHYKRCMQDVEDGSPESEWLERTMRLFMNGISVNARQTDDYYARLCPTLPDLCNLSSPVNIPAFRHCFPLRSVCTNTSLVDIMPYPPLEVSPLGGRTWHGIPCTSFEPNLVQTTGTIYSAGLYVGIGIGGSII